MDKCTNMELGENRYRNCNIWLVEILGENLISWNEKWSEGNIQRNKGNFLEWKTDRKGQQNNISMYFQSIFRHIAVKVKNIGCQAGSVGRECNSISASWWVQAPCWAWNLLKKKKKDKDKEKNIKVDMKIPLCQTWFYITGCYVVWSYVQSALIFVCFLCARYCARDLEAYERRFLP